MQTTKVRKESFLFYWKHCLYWWEIEIFVWRKSELIFCLRRKITNVIYGKKINRKCGSPGIKINIQGKRKSRTGLANY